MEEININEVGIYNGIDFWPEYISAGAEWISIGKRSYYLYKDMPKSMYESLMTAKEKYPDKCCIVDDSGVEFTYSHFFQLVNDFSKVLFDTYHVKKGDHIGVLLYNSIEFCVTIYAINRLSAVAVPLSTKYKQPETLSLIEKADISGIVCHRDFVQWFPDEDNNMFVIEFDVDKMAALSCDRFLSEIPYGLPELIDNAILMFTSGTTSRSKGVLMANYNVMHAIAVYQKIFSITKKDRTVLPIPAYHVTGLVAVIGLFVHAGACLWIHKFFDASRVLMQIQREQVTFFHASPTVFSLLLEHKSEYPMLPDLRIFACGSSNMPAKRIQEIKEWLPQLEFRMVYGLTETTSPAAILPIGAADSDHIGSSGRPVPGVYFKICDEDGNALEPLETGTVMVSGSTVTVGYYRQEGQLFKNGWLDTGDLGYFDKEGYLYLVDRKKDMINRGGEKVCSFDVENVLYGIPGIREAAVVGIPDERYGEVPVAMLVTEDKSELTIELIHSYLKKHLAKFQIPVKFLFTYELPMTANMKVDKKKIRDLFSQNHKEMLY